MQMRCLLHLDLKHPYWRGFQNLLALTVRNTLYDRILPVLTYIHMHEIKIRISKIITHVLTICRALFSSGLSCIKMIALTF